MKAILLSAVIVGLASAASAQGIVPPTNPSRHVCLQSFLVDHTTTVNPSVILFHMRNGTIWQNTLAQPCRGLMFHGFVYNTEDTQICSDMQSISVIQTHEVCMLGAFTPYTPPPKAAPAANSP